MGPLSYSSFSIEHEIERTLRYFEFFKHALNIEEIRTFLRVQASIADLENALQPMADSQQLFYSEGFYALNPDHIQVRKNCQNLNLGRLKIARRMGYFIQLFPYVRGVYLSGSLSNMGMQNASDDIDFFIITKAGRVWLAKLFLIGFKKLFLLNSEKYFCINMLMDERKLKLKKKNLYTAAEAASLLPLTHPEIMAHFLQENSWLSAFLPNFVFPNKPEPPAAYSKWTEQILEVLGAEKLEQWARGKFHTHMTENASGDSSYYEAEAHSSAYFPDSVEQKLMDHYNVKSK